MARSYRAYRWKRREEPRNLHVEQIRGTGDARAAFRRRLDRNDDLLGPLPAERAELRTLHVEKGGVERRARGEERPGPGQHLVAAQRRRRLLNGCLRSTHAPTSIDVSTALGSYRNGTSSRNADPSPGDDASEMSPCTSRASRCASASPNPAPPCWRVIVPSTCLNSSNTSRWASGGIPIPVSSTRYTARSPTTCSETRTEPSCVNFNALSSSADNARAIVRRSFSIGSTVSGS